MTFEGKGWVPRYKISVLERDVCHYCHHSPFNLSVTQEDSDGIIEGVLECPQCRRKFPIRDGMADLFVPINPKCLYCDETVDHETALRQFEIRNAIQDLHTRSWVDAERRLDHPDAANSHCDKEAVEVLIAYIQASATNMYGRKPDPTITRISVEKGITRDAARKWLKRHSQSS